jgi:hypothetical protein
MVILIILSVQPALHEYEDFSEVQPLRIGQALERPHLVHLRLGQSDIRQRVALDISYVMLHLLTNFFLQVSPVAFLIFSASQPASVLRC